jgi:anti-sigma factor RsiW
MSKPPPLNDRDHEDLVAFLDGELTDEQARAMERRVNLDPRVRAEADAYKRTWDLLDFLPRPEASVSFTEKTLSRVATVQKAARSPKPISWCDWRWPAWAAVLTIAALAGFMGQRLMSHEPGKEELVRDLRIIENKKFYDLVDDMGFLKKLDSDDLFGENSTP